MMKLKYCFVLSVMFLVACAEDKNSDGASNPIPSMVQISRAVLPTSLESSGVNFFPSSLFSTNADLAELKTRIFSPGPTDFLDRLQKVDSRLNEMASRVSSCATLTTQTYTPPAFVTGLSFPMEFACKETVGNGTSMGMSVFDIYFGKANGYWYLAEIQVNAGFSSGDAEPPTMAVIAKVSEDGNDMEVWQISVENKSSVNYASVVHITADKAAGVFSLSTASSADNTQTISPGANFTGLGCGVRMITNGTDVYAEGKFSQAASCPSQTTVCTQADLSTAGSCSSISGSSEFLALLARADVSGNNAKAMIVDGSGLPTF